MNIIENREDAWLAYCCYVFSFFDRINIFIYCVRSIKKLKNIKQLKMSQENIFSV